MGIDLYQQGRVKSRELRQTASSNVYIRLLIRLYKFLARRTKSHFNYLIYKRLSQSRINRYPISLSSIVRNFKPYLEKKQKKLIVCVCNVLDDERMLQLPKGLEICALKFSESARKRIVANGGKCLTFDQLAIKSPLGKDTLLLRGPKSREALRHFGLAPGQIGSHTKPYVTNKSVNIERAVGRREKKRK